MISFGKVLVKCTLVHVKTKSREMHTLAKLTPVNFFQNVGYQNRLYTTSHQSSWPCSQTVLAPSTTDFQKRRRNLTTSSTFSAPKTDREISNNRVKKVPQIDEGDSLIKSALGIGVSRIGTKLLDFNRDDWITVYRFPKIRLCGLIQRVKIIQTAFTSLIIFPSTIGCYVYGMIQELQLAYGLGLSVLASVMLYVMGNFCSRLIGFIYVSKNDPSLVRIGHMNFWGRREDHLFQMNEFIPFSELPDNLSDVYVHVKFYSDPSFKLYLCLRYGVITDFEKIQEIFGSHVLFAIADKDGPLNNNDSNNNNTKHSRRRESN